MTKPKRSLEYRGKYDIPVDNVQVARPDTVDREVPNLYIDPLINRNYSLYSTGIGYNMHGELIDYHNNGKLVTEEEAKQRAKEYAIRKKANRTKDALEDLRLHFAIGRNKYK